MKTNRSFVRSSFETLLLAAALGIMTVLAVKAENDLNFDTLNGLFTPTQSERFFQAGREDFEQEVEVFNHPERYLSEDLLQIDSELIEQINQGQFYPDFDLENYPDEMN